MMFSPVQLSFQFDVEDGGRPLAAALALLCGRSAATASIELRRLSDGGVSVKMLAPASLEPGLALGVGAGLAAMPGVRGVAVLALRRRDRPGCDGDMVERRELGRWSRGGADESESESESESVWALPMLDAAA